METPRTPGRRPQDGGWAADDLDLLTGLPSRTELIDGSLVFPTPQTVFHERAISFVQDQLRRAAPGCLEVIYRFAVNIDRQNRPAPDLIVVHDDALPDPAQTCVPASAVILAVEVVTEATLTRDRETKPVQYSRAKIPHYWRIENEKGLAVVHAFELEPTTGTYTSTGIFRERMKVPVPFPMDLDLTQIRTRRTRDR